MNLQATIDLTNEIARENLTSDKITRSVQEKMHLENLIDVQRSKMYAFEDELDLIDLIDDCNTARWKRINARMEKCEDLIKNYEQRIVAIDNEVNTLNE